MLGDISGLSKLSRLGQSTITDSIFDSAYQIRRPPVRPQRQQQRDVVFMPNMHRVEVEVFQTLRQRLQKETDEWLKDVF